MPHEEFRSQPRAWALALALMLAFVAQYLFTGEFFTRVRDSNTWEWGASYTIASILLVAATGFAGWAASCDRWLPNPHRPVQIGAPAVDSTRLDSFLIYACTCYALSLIVYWTVGENLIVQWLWLAGVALLVVPLWARSATDIETDAVRWQEWVVMIVITIIGFTLRYWRLTEIPSHVDNDVALMGTFAQKLIDTGNYNWIGYSDSEHLLSYDQLLAWSMRLFGQNHYGLIMSSVIAGTLTLPLVYLLGREMFNWRIGSIAMMLLAINYTHIHFSRILFGPLSTFFATLTIYLLLKGIHTRHPRWFALAGLSAGIGLLFYDSSRVVPIVVLAILAWRLLWNRDVALANRKSWAILLLGMLIGFGPMAGFAVRDFHSFVGRGNGVTLWTPGVWEHEVSAYGAESAGEVLVEQAKRVLLTFHLYGDGSPHFALPRPMAAPLTAALLVIGLGYCLLRLKDSRFFSLIAWILLTLVLGGIITYDPPFWPHLNIMLPAVAIISALAADRIIEAFSTEMGRLGRVTLVGITVVAISLTGYLNWQAYYGYVKDNAGPRIRMARYIDGLPRDYHVHLVSDIHDWSEYSFQFFNRSVSGTDATADGLISSPPALDRPLLFVLYDHQNLLGFLQKQYPTGKAKEHLNNEGTMVFVSFEVAPVGYSFQPVSKDIYPLTLPGWWIIGATIAAALSWQMARGGQPS